ncbi:MAG: hypothetical protein M0Z76_05810 [Gammaproteobacteria bacterium]|nr:hypothetical protein [Gammaproteobacteria bacterium]
MSLLDQLRRVPRVRESLREMLPQAIKPDPTPDEAKLTVAMTRLDVIWEQLFPTE